MRQPRIFSLFVWVLALHLTVSAQTGLVEFEEALDQRRFTKAEALLGKIADRDARTLAQCELFLAGNRPDRTFALVEQLDTKNLAPGLLAKYYYVRASQESSLLTGAMEEMRERIFRLTREGLRASPSPHDRRKLILLRIGWVHKDQYTQGYDGAKELGEFSGDWGLEAQAKLAGGAGDDKQARILWTSLMDSARLRKQDRLEVSYGLSLVRTLRRLEQEAEADALLRKLLAVAQKSEEPASVARVASKLARRLVRTGRVDEADRLMKQTLSSLPKGELQARLLYHYAKSLPDDQQNPHYQRGVEIATELDDTLMLAAFSYELADNSVDEYRLLSNKVADILEGVDTRGAASAWFGLFIRSKPDRPVAKGGETSAFLAKLESAETPKERRRVCRNTLDGLQLDHSVDFGLARVVLEQYNTELGSLGGLDLAREMSYWTPDDSSLDWLVDIKLTEAELFRWEARVWTQAVAHSWQRDYSSTNEDALSGFVGKLKSASSPRERSDALVDFANYLRFLGRDEEATEILGLANGIKRHPGEESRAFILAGRFHDALPVMKGPLWKKSQSTYRDPWRDSARIAWVCLSAEDYAGAREWSERTIDLFPPEKDVQTLVYVGAPQVLARALMAESKHEQADARLQEFTDRVMAADGSPDELLVERAELLRRAGQPQKAQEIFERASRGYRDSVRLYRANIGWKIAKDLGDTAKLEEMDKKLLSIVEEMKTKVNDPILSHFLFSQPEFQALPISVDVPPLPPAQGTTASFGEVLEQLEKLRRREPDNIMLGRLSAADLRGLMTEAGPTEVFVQPVVLDHSVVLVCVVKGQAVVIERFCDTTRLEQSMVRLSATAADHGKTEGLEADRRRVTRWLVNPWRDLFPSHDDVRWMGEGDLQSFQLSLLSPEPSGQGLSIAYLDGPGLGSSSVDLPSSALLIGGAEDLAGARIELEQVRKLFPQGKSWTLGAKFGDLKLLAEQHSLVHIATHGMAPSGQRLGGEFRGTEGRLNAFSLSELEFPAKTLAVVSACEGGQSFGKGHDNTSLLSALRTAGAEVVVGSVWSVDDTVGQELFLEFYRQLKTNPDPSHALAAAQQLVKKTHPHPYYWAGVRVVTGP
jgi:tetratricopeptide (TPR) repeat protein